MCILKFRDPSLNRSPFEKFYPKPLEAVFSTVYRDHFLAEVDDDVISAAAVGNVDVDVGVKLGDSRSNGSRDIRRADFVSNERT